MSGAFVQISLDIWEAWRSGRISNEERDLAFYIALETDFRTGTLSTTLERMASELGWDVERSTVARRLGRLERLGFVVAEIIGEGNRRRHLLRPTPSLLKTGRVAQQSPTSRATDDGAPRAGLRAADATRDATVEEKREIEVPSVTPEDPSASMYARAKTAFPKTSSGGLEATGCGRSSGRQRCEKTHGVHLPREAPRRPGGARPVLRPEQSRGRPIRGRSGA